MLQAAPLRKAVRGPVRPDEKVDLRVIVIRMSKLELDIGDGKEIMMNELNRQMPIQKFEQFHFIHV